MCQNVTLLEIACHGSIIHIIRGVEKAKFDTYLGTRNCPLCTRPNKKNIVAGLDKKKIERKIVNIFLPISFNICFGCSKEPSHCDGSFDYPQNMLWLRNKKISFSISTLNLSPVLSQKTDDAQRTSKSL